jgi:hypothetical protein
VPARALLVVVRRVEELDPEVLARRELDVLSAEVERDEEGSLRDLALLLDRCLHQFSLVAGIVAVLTRR